jgi:glucose/arabinose dehydrogenase
MMAEARPFFRTSLIALLLAFIAAFTSPVARSQEAPPPAEDVADDEDAPAARSQPSPSLVCDPDNGGLTLPPGFCALVVADNVGRARHLVVRRNGDLYVAVNPAPDGSDPGRLLALRDLSRDGRADVVETIAEVGGNGVALDVAQRFLYFAQNDRVVRYRLRGNALLPDGPPAVIVSGLPADGDHRSKTIVLDGRGGFFLNIGSASNTCQVENRVPFSPGVDPCPELAVRAGVWRFSDRPGQTQANGVRFASGLRNMVALARQPRTGQLWGVQNGRDQLFENWPTLFTEEDDREAPAEEVIRIFPGRNNGWPYCYEDPRLGSGGDKVLAPEYGGDGTERGRCAAIPDSPLDLPAHWAPLSMLFYTGRQFPDSYRRDAFVTSHGARFPGPAEGPGYNVTRIRFRDGRPISRETFADGFTGGATDLPAGAAHRPVGLAQGPDGSLYITSDHNDGRIWRVIYRRP